MTIIRRDLLKLSLVSAVGTAAPVWGQSVWPSKTITFVVGFPPGGNIDYLARIMASELAARLNHAVVVENITGAGGNLATAAMVRGAADGHTIGFAAITMATNPTLMKNLGYDPLKDVAMVGQMSTVPVVVVVGAHTPYKTLAEVVSAAKAKPQAVSFGHGGTGTSGFLAAALLGKATGIEFMHVPFKGTAPILQAILGGHIDGTFAVSDTNLPALAAQGKIRALAVLQESRIATLPNVPTARELGFPSSTDFGSWHGIMVRSGTPANVIERLHSEVTAVIQSPKLKDLMAKAALEPRTSASPAAFNAFYRSEITRWQELAQQVGLVAE